MIRPEDDLFHPHLDVNQDPYWNESSWFSVWVPELSIGGFFYFYHRPNMKLTSGGFALWDPSGDEVHNCLFYDWDLQQAQPEGCDMFDFRLRDGKGLEVKLLEPLQRYALKYHGDGCEVDLVFDAIHPPVEQRHPEPDFQKRVNDITAVNASMSSWAASHYEHFGRMTGTVDIVGHPTIQIDAYSIHDRSWGPRDIKGKFRRGDLHCAVASEASHFNLMATTGLASSEDPIFGTVEPVRWGYYCKDGEISYLVDGENRIERGEDGRPRRAIVTATDELGRALEAVGTPANVLKWPGYPDFIMLWSGAWWEFDGQVAYGEIANFMSACQYRGMVRQRTGQAVMA